VKPFLLSGERVEIGGAPCLILVSRDLTDRKRRETLVSEIAQGVASQTGESFFRSLVSHLGRALEADLTFVGEVVPGDETRVRTIAVRGPEAMEPEFSYELEGSPCKTILGQGMCVYPCDVATLFPKDRGLARRGIQAYVGAPLNDSRGRPLGLLAVMFRRPIEDSRLVENLIRIFAARAAGELQRGNDLRDLEHLAHHDPLTGLPNRRLVQDRMERALQLARRNKEQFAVMVVDLDRFKVINDTYGHATGDEVLRAVAARLGASIRKADTVARHGGDEFIVLLPELRQAQDALSVAEKVIAGVSAPIDVEGRLYHVGASVGLAVYPEDAGDVEELLRRADDAMYVAKQSGGNRALRPAA
jgi:diguanylate cyclase (GGDEF)-like protein